MPNDSPYSKIFPFVEFEHVHSALINATKRSRRQKADGCKVFSFDLFRVFPELSDNFFDDEFVALEEIGVFA